MAYPVTSDTYTTLDEENIDTERAVLALFDRFRANDKLPAAPAVQTGLGTTGTATLGASSSDFRGQITLTPGGTGIAAGAQAIITPTSVPAGWSATNSAVLLTPMSPGAGANAVQAYVTLTGTTWTLNFVVAGVAATVYTYGYEVIA